MTVHVAFHMNNPIMRPRVNLHLYNTYTSTPIYFDWTLGRRTPSSRVDLQLQRGRSTYEVGAQDERTRPYCISGFISVSLGIISRKESARCVVHIEYYKQMHHIPSYHQSCLNSKPCFCLTPHCRWRIVKTESVILSQYIHDCFGKRIFTTLSQPSRVHPFVLACLVVFN